MSVVTKSILYEYFQQSDEPTEDQFRDLLDSYIHKTSDKNYLGIGVFDEDREYFEDELTNYQGVLYIFKKDFLGGPWDTDYVVSFPCAAYRFGFDLYDDLTSWIADDKVVYRHEAYICLLPVTGVKPDDTGSPSGSTYWRKLKCNGHWEHSEYETDKCYKLYDFCFEAGIWYYLNTSFLLSVDFATELAANSWKRIGDPDVSIAPEIFIASAGQKEFILSTFVPTVATKVTTGGARLSPSLYTVGADRITTTMEQEEGTEIIIDLK